MSAILGSAADWPRFNLSHRRPPRPLTVAKCRQPAAVCRRQPSSGAQVQKRPSILTSSHCLAEEDISGHDQDIRFR